MNAPNYFIPDRDRPAFYPLRDFLRAPPISTAAQYIEQLTVPGDLVIDPFGAMPNIAQAALALRRRAIVADSNPLWAWLARAMATLPAESTINAALARLGDALKDETPLRAHIAQLYTTPCGACGKPTPAEYFVHTRSDGLVRRHYTCVHCNATRDDPATEQDRRLADSFEAHGLHYHVAFDRVVPEDNAHADRIRRMLDIYVPRALYTLVTLTQKIDSLFRGTREHDILLLLLLHLLDRGTSFYAEPSARAQLTSHKQFVEFNLWHEIESAAQALAGSPSITLADSAAEVAASGEPSVWIGRGNAPALARELPRRSVALVLSAPPLRRIAVWGLAYFWGAWILGRSAVAALAPFLNSKSDSNWEWRWYSETLNASMRSLHTLLRADTHAVFAFDEAWQLVIEALLLAASDANLALESFVFQPHLGDLPRREFEDIRGHYRIAFVRAPASAKGATDLRELEKRIHTSALAAGTEILTHRGEALAFSWVHHAAYSRIAHEGLLAQIQETPKGISPGRFIHHAVVTGLSEGYAHDLDHYSSPEQLVWLRRSRLASPLVDRVEDAVQEMFSQRDTVSSAELEDSLYRQFAGDLTPEEGLIALCASTYAEERDGMWHRRIEDSDAVRSRALDSIAHLGQRLDYAVVRDESPFDVCWKMDGELAHGFIWQARVRFTNLIQIHIAPARGHLLMPEPHVALLRERIRRLPHLADAFHEAGWDFMRMPFVDRALNADKIERSDLPLIVGLVPPAERDRTQLELL